MISHPSQHVVVIVSTMSGGALTSTCFYTTTTLLHQPGKAAQKVEISMGSPAVRLFQTLDFSQLFRDEHISTSVGFFTTVLLLQQQHQTSVELERRGVCRKGGQ
jgi:hypothetical protein